jgi:hypothetical protein
LLILNAGSPPKPQRRQRATPDNSVFVLRWRLSDLFIDCVLSFQPPAGIHPWPDQPMVPISSRIVSCPSNLCRFSEDELAVAPIPTLPAQRRVIQVFLASDGRSLAGPDGADDKTADEPGEPSRLPGGTGSRSAERISRHIGQMWDVCASSDHRCGNCDVRPRWATP